MEASIGRLFSMAADFFPIFCSLRIFLRLCVNRILQCYTSFESVGC